ncbi:cation diffusion facilitator family transporter [Sulfobacillus harzensis]|uniref:Cation transporter n=1 Tax=Sulfobacillus harzensis TaxID=2729629 RepID=A0A7Y0L0M9_9FIRM|nr:cation transporter [Sulfobacillus harzensis]
MHTHDGPTRQLIWALLLTGAIFVLQLVGALMSQSLSLLSNAGHLFTDLGSIGLALYAAKVGQHRPTQELSYGYSRSGIVAAFVNGLILAAIAIALMISSIYRFIRPAPVNASVMLVVTIITLGLNLATSWVLHPPQKSRDINRWGVYWHALGDAFSSLGILLAALLIDETGWNGWDPVAALAVGLFILWASWKTARPSLRILMEATPEGTRLDEIRQTFLSHPDVNDVHHLHVWSISPELHALSAHIRLGTTSIRDGQRVIEQLNHDLAAHHDIHHVTLQIEAEQHDDPDDGIPTN